MWNFCLKKLLKPKFQNQIIWNCNPSRVLLFYASTVSGRNIYRCKLIHSRPGRDLERDRATYCRIFMFFPELFDIRTQLDLLDGVLHALQPKHSPLTSHYCLYI